MDLENLNGQMEEGTSVTMFKIKKRDMASFFGLITEFIKGSGKTVNNMEKQYSFYQTNYKELEFGKMASELNG